MSEFTVNIVSIYPFGPGKLQNTNYCFFLTILKPAYSYLQKWHMKRQFNWPDTLTIKLIVSVLVIEELQPDHSKDVDDDNQDEG